MQQMPHDWSPDNTIALLSDGYEFLRNTFRPERFADWDESPYNFIPQGGGDSLQNHRCAGEWIMIALMKQAVDFLVNTVDYDVPPQDVEVDLSRMPAIPESRFVIGHARRD